ncbi:MAG: type II secretion system protein [Patescibacteria group bacterium]
MKNIKRFKNESRKEGFTLIEILVVIGILAVLATIVLVAINPARQFKLARDSQRSANVTAILNAIGQNLTDNRGLFTCSGINIPTTSAIIRSGGIVDIAGCLVPTYIASLPFDPSIEGAYYVSEDDYNTGYEVSADSLGRITVAAISEITGNVISVTR